MRVSPQQLLKKFLEPVSESVRLCILVGKIIQAPIPVEKCRILATGWGDIRMSYNDKRIIINSRQPKENEFVMVENVQMNDSWVRQLMDYIDKNSNLSVEWIDREHFVERSMMGFKLVKKDEWRLEGPIKTRL